ncbi:zinc-binding dehydrogenase [Psychrobacter sp. AOP22-C1-22]|uniref:zinc-binding dehydrogenase n=1 Tax=unclassified Psychrobacter TaxID=196806 RepID=UPI001787D4F0|nr:MULTISPECIES: zinc-binding dehydrogenase [unclassified Psychrobacter]MBE0408018.1 zinc-binding dehydrogenase [Psychrobacter sp. FME6]MBE0445465.1 zinc-binding dehydrogenase [Psychrobacter sp. FME5]MDN5801455.1 zinc-binding dehydrogenase [Psychrobacter sp.]MDN5897936.1 zinc-binding dehydrogenase [Psychrobacter sp.]
MRSATYDHFGKPTEVLSVGDRPTPEPKANEVRVKTILASIHNHDLLTIRGKYGFKPQLPAIGGSEALGVIDAVGSEVKDLKVGQRVAAASVQATWAEYFVASADMVFPVPDSLKDEMAAQLIAMPLSALMLLEFLEVESGQWVIHNAANGAVGKSLAMLAAARGVKTINLVRSSDALGELEALDIKNNINTSDDDWKDQVKAIIGDDKISAAVDSVGGEASGNLLSLLGHGGVFAVFGAMSGKPMMLNPTDMIFKQAILKGFWGSKLSQEMSVDNKKRLVKELIDRAVDGKLKLPVEAVFDLKDVLKAVDGKLQSEKKGKVLLRA